MGHSDGGVLRRAVNRLATSAKEHEAAELRQDCVDLGATLIRDVGFNPVDLGSLSMARYVEPFSLLVAQLAYSGSAGPQVAYRFERLAKRKSS